MRLNCTFEVLFGKRILSQNQIQTFLREFQTKGKNLDFDFKASGFLESEFLFV